MRVINAPMLRLEEGDNPGDALLNWYNDLGWDGQAVINPVKVRTTETIWNELIDFIAEAAGDQWGASMLIMNSGPGVSSDVKEGKVKLYEGWLSQ